MSFGSNFDECWWCFITEPAMCLQIVDTIVERHTMWQFTTDPLLQAIEESVNSQQYTKDIFHCIVCFLFPEPSVLRFDKKIFSDSKYQNVVVSDQCGGLISCGKCINTTNNPIFQINKCHQRHIDNHLNSIAHLDA